MARIDSAFAGRTFAAYGGVYIAASLVWLWLIEGGRPDRFYRRQNYRLLDLVYGPEPLRDKPLDAAIALAANTMPEPDMASAERHEVRFDGGMMGAMMTSRSSGAMMEMMRAGKIWFINGVAATGHVMDQLLTLEKGRSYLLDMQSHTAWHHPIHLHGHSFCVISRIPSPLALHGSFLSKVDPP